MSEEEWRPIPGYEGHYSVSSRGRVRSEPRVLRDGRRWQGKVLTARVQRSGYLEVNLGGALNRKRHLVHRLVCMAFKGDPPEGKPYACHLDGNRFNNASSNLYWGSPSDNMYDRTRHGTHHNSKTHCKYGHELTPDNVYRPPALPRSRYCRACRRRRGRKYYLNQLEEDRG